MNTLLLLLLSVIYTLCIGTDVDPSSQPVVAEECHCAFKETCGDDTPDVAASEYISIDIPWVDPLAQCQSSYLVLVIGRGRDLAESGTDLYTACGANVTIGCVYTDDDEQTQCGALERSCSSNSGLTVISYTKPIDQSADDQLFDRYMALHGSEPDILVFPGDSLTELYTREKDGDRKHWDRNQVNARDIRPLLRRYIIAQCTKHYV